MNHPIRAFLIAFLSLTAAGTTSAQEVIKLPKTDDSNVTWTGDEKQYFSQIWQTEVVTNVSRPTMEIYRPEGANTGTAVVIAPGGGLYAQSIMSEGRQVAQWLAKKGVTGVVLKYRLVPTGDDGVAEISKESMVDPKGMFDKVAQVLPYSVTDGLNAIAYLKEHATAYGIDPAKIGFMGFSAGGAVTMGVGYGYDASNRPGFLVPVYPWTDAQAVQPPKPDTPPMFIVCASDDPLGLAKGSVELYTSMFTAQRSVALQMYAKGGHGFGMRTQGLPSDRWIERFYDWAISEKLIAVSP
ncbi:MAG: alpha/beta hydrolase [Flavobacteriaceae bacterium]|nr:alpha/beta hydrolase [Flavobacteriaceae bacterium]